MARFARVVLPDVPHHVTQRGNRRQKVFFRNADYEAYLDLLREWPQRYGLEISAYCLMPNHVHLIAVPSTPAALAAAVGEIHKRYSRAINFRMGWRGFLFQGRFGSFAMDEDHLWTAVRYVLLNPVRAELAAAAADWPWSSIHAHLAGTDPRGIVNVARLAKPPAFWREFLRRSPAEAELDLLRRHARTGRPLGSRRFIARAESTTGRTLRLKPPGRPRKTPSPTP